MYFKPPLFQQPSLFLFIQVCAVFCLPFRFPFSQECIDVEVNNHAVIIECSAIAKIHLKVHKILAQSENKVKRECRMNNPATKLSLLEVSDN